MQRIYIALGWKLSPAKLWRGDEEFAYRLGDVTVMALTPSARASVLSQKAELRSPLQVGLAASSLSRRQVAELEVDITVKAPAITRVPERKLPIARRSIVRLLEYRNGAV